MVGVGRGRPDGGWWLLFLVLTFFLRQLGSSLGDGQVHSSQDDPRFEGLAFDSKRLKA